MKILLINPPFTVEKPWGDLYKAGGGNSVPLGLAYLAACAELHGHEVRVIDCVAHAWDVARLKAKLKGMDFQVAGISVMTPMATAAYRTAALIRAVNPAARVVLGGPHVSALPIESLNECPEADFVVVGEGEETFMALLSSLENNTRAGDIPGLAYRENREIFTTPDAGHVVDLDALPLPAYHLFAMDLYRPPVTKYRRLPAFSVVTGRGCPYSCSFCSKVVHGKRLRQRSVANVMQELSLLKERYGAKGIIFQDSSLCQDRQWVLDLCEAMIASGINLEWSCLSRVEQVDYPLLLRMEQAGCWQISYGIESGSQKTLDLLRKNNTLEQTEAAVVAAHRAGIQVRATYMVAVPGETREDVLSTIRYAKKLGTMYASFQVTVPLPGTVIYEEAHARKGTVCLPSCWEDYHFFNKDMPFYIPEGMSREELRTICEKAWVSYYLSIRVVLRHLCSLRSFADFPKYLGGMKGLTRMIR